MAKQQILIDDKNYTVVGINGFRQGSLTFEQAVKMACRMQEQMDRAGWRGKMEVYYRDGTRIEWRDRRNTIRVEGPA